MKRIRGASRVEHAQERGQEPRLARVGEPEAQGALARRRDRTRRGDRAASTSASRCGRAAGTSRSPRLSQDEAAARPARTAARRRRC